MNFKSKWAKLPVWLKWGIYFGAISIILSLFILMTTTGEERMLLVLLHLPAYYLMIKLFPNWMEFSTTAPVYADYFITLVLGTTFYFLIGSLIGWIVQKKTKAKAKKTVKKTKNKK